MAKVLVFGATGLVGGKLLNLLVQKPGPIFALARRPLSNKNQKIREFIMDFDRLDETSECFQVDTVFCAIGSTIKKAGSQSAFRKIDYEYPLKIAKLARVRGARQFLLVSALGADPSSRIFYNQVKGDLERDISALGFESVTIVRPSLILGERAERRSAERLGQYIGRFMPRVWRAVPAERIAQALVKALEKPVQGVTVIENAQLF